MGIGVITDNFLFRGDTECRNTARMTDSVELINAERAKAGVQPLAFDNDLSEAAEGHSKWMLAADVLHIPVPAGRMARPHV